MDKWRSRPSQPRPRVVAFVLLHFRPQLVPSHFFLDAQSPSSKPCTLLSTLRGAVIWRYYLSGRWHDPIKDGPIFSDPGEATNCRPTQLLPNITENAPSHFYRAFFYAGPGPQRRAVRLRGLLPVALPYRYPFFPF